MKLIFDQVSMQCSSITTHNYSTSFSLGIRCMHHKIRNPICSIYGFVRFADEIVDSFHGYDKKALLKKFEKDTYEAIGDKISLNPILNSFQSTVNKFQIEYELIDLFLRSMEMDLYDTNHDEMSFQKYILGSAEVVGLMCLRVFTNGDEEYYQRLKPSAMRLGSAFQKVNFLRDLRADFKDLGRSYFPDLNISELNDHSKIEIEQSIEKDFKEGYKGIKGLPKSARFGVYLAYIYYYSLFKKIRKTPATQVLKSRIRIPDNIKYIILLKSYLKDRLNLI